VSIEPGYYETGNFGIRLENLYLIQRATPTPTPGEVDDLQRGSYYQFESLTYVPFQRNLIERSLLSVAQIKWINSYHQQVYERIKGVFVSQLSQEESAALCDWLKENCEPI
jgi:Xaa-Pro aminopeptidase